MASNKEIGKKTSLTSRASTCITDQPSDELRSEDMSNEELKNAVENLKTANQLIFLENEIFETYLKHMDPSLLTGFNKLVEQATAAVQAQIRAQAITTAMLHPMSSSMSVSNLSMRRGTDESLSSQQSPGPSGGIYKSYSVMKFGTGSLLSRGPRINTSHKIDMASREMEELRIALEKMQKQSKLMHADLHAQIEELSAMIKEVKESDEELTRNIIIGAIDSLTHTIPAEKFIRHMEEWFKQADSMLGKLRLKTSTLRSLNIRIQAQLEQKLELGETLHPADFDQLRIENLECLKKVEQKNQHLLEMKKMTGKCNLQLTNFKDRMASELQELKYLKDVTASKHALIETLNKESVLVLAEVEKAEEKLYRVTSLRGNFMVPDVIEYAKKKAELTNLKKEVKVWSRRYSIQHVSLVSCMHAVQRMAANGAHNMNAYFRKPRTALSRPHRFIGREQVVLGPATSPLPFN